MKNDLHNEGQTSKRSKTKQNTFFSRGELKGSLEDEKKNIGNLRQSKETRYIKSLYLMKYIGLNADQFGPHRIFIKAEILQDFLVV